MLIFQEGSIFLTAVVHWRGVRTQVKNPKRIKSKCSRRLLGRMDWETHLSLYPNPRKKPFPKEELVSSGLEETAGSGHLPKRK